MKLVIDLFIAFAKIGSFTFGGGYAMLPMIKKEILLKLILINAILWLRETWKRKRKAL